MYLMHENIPVADVSIYLGNISGIREIFHPEHLPVGTNHPGPLHTQYLNAWLRDRAIPLNRKSLDLYTKYFGYPPMEAAQFVGSFSLTDHYWFKEEQSSDTWEELCFQNNGFSSNFADFFLDCLSGQSPDSGGFWKIPDLNTDGVLPKVWIQTGNEFRLCKMGEVSNLTGIKSNGEECHLLSANEVVCSKIAEMMGIDAVPYSGVFLPGISHPVCECPNFVPSDMEFVTLAQIAKESAGQKIDLYGKVCEMGFKKELEDMLRFFFLIHNKDGHTKNCGVLRNAKTLEVVSFAPLFDHGNSLNFDGLGTSDHSVKPFRATRLEQIALVDSIGYAPSFSSMAEVVKETYDFFGVSEEHTDLALEDLIKTCNEWERIAEMEAERDNAM